MNYNFKDGKIGLRGQIECEKNDRKRAAGEFEFAKAKCTRCGYKWELFLLFNGPAEGLSCYKCNKLSGTVTGFQEDK